MINTKIFTILILAACCWSGNISAMLSSHSFSTPTQEFEQLSKSEKSVGGDVNVEKRQLLDINDTDLYGHNALMLAVYYGDLSIVEILLACDDVELEDKDTEGMTALMIAASRGKYEIAKALLRQAQARGISIVDATDGNGMTALMWAVVKGYVPIVELLVEDYQANINMRNYDDKTALGIALCMKRMDIVKLLQRIQNKSNNPDAL